MKEKDNSFYDTKEKNLKELKENVSKQTNELKEFCNT